MLIYELVVRGVPVDDSKTVDKLRSALRPLIKLEKTGSFTYPPYNLNFAEERSHIRAFLDEANNAVRTLSGESAQNKFLSTQSRLVHLLHRTNRIPAPRLTPEEQDERSELLVEILASLDSLEDVSRNDPELSRHFVDLDEVAHPPQHNSTRHPLLQNYSPSQSAQPPNKNSNVEKWNIKFSGDSKKLSLHNFLERVTELRVARHVTEKQLFDSAIDLFEGRALNWFRANKGRFNNWSEMVDLLRLHFEPPDYKSRLFREILDRTQDPSESIVDYMSCMQALFRRYEDLPDVAQLDILCRNLSPFYSTQLPVVTTLEQLEAECLKLETKKYRVDNYVPPSRKRQQLVEPDFAFVEVQNPLGNLANDFNNVSIYNPSHTDQVDELNVDAVQQQTIRRDLVCWNCQKPGHLNRNCPDPRKTHCFRCGTPNVTVRTCGKCSLSGNGSRGNR